MPICPRCDSDSWASNGGHFGGEVNSQTFSCKSCNAGYLMNISSRGVSIFLTFREEHWEVKEGSKESPISDYVNNHLLAALRYARKNSLELKIPKIPEGISIYFEGQKYTCWETSENETPVDPILSDHLERWKKIFNTLGIGNYIQIENRYTGTLLEPWFQFEYLDRMWTVGPRKRVDVIEVENHPNLGPIINLAKVDNVTYYGERGDKFGIHAWTSEKFLEYFLLLRSTITCQN